MGNKNRLIEEFGLDFQEDHKFDEIDESNEKISFDDAYWITRNECGKINLDYWSMLTGLEKDSIIEKGRGTYMFQDPKYFYDTGDMYDGWMPKEQYYSGNILKKYREAVWMNKKTGGLFEENEKFLKGKLPENVMIEDIHIGLGATWVPVELIAAFVQKLLDTKEIPKVENDEYLGKWSIHVPSIPNYVLNYHTYGTRKISAVKIIEKILNSIPVKVYDQVPREDGKGNDSVLNRTETLAAQAKKRLILEEWANYCHSEPYIEEFLQERFSARYGYGMTTYDGSFLTFPDLNPNITLYPYQKNGIAHIIMSPNTLLAHDVGAGKTYAYECGIHECIRMGLCKKALVVVSKATLDAVYQAYRELYPDDAVLKVEAEKEFAIGNRTKTLEKMKSDKYKVVFISYGSFDKLTLSKKETFANKEKEIHECITRKENARNYREKTKYDNKLKSLLKKYEKFKEEFEDGETACFDELGFDILCVDEAHHYKNLTIDFGDTNIVGFHAKGSKKADNLLEKVGYIQKMNGKVIFATGTPITNSLADIYVLQRYLQPAELKMCNIYHFGDWISTFCTEETSFEMDVDSKNCRFVTRFNKFHNLIELMNMFSEVCDFYQCDPSELCLPEFDGYTDIVVKRTEELKQFIDSLAERTEAIRNHEVRRTEDNLLKITVEGRLGALDMRIVNPNMIYGDQESKILACARQVMKFYYEYPGMTQAIFSDISTPKKEGFDVYHEMKNTLVSMGIPEEEIRFIHEANTDKKRAKMERDFNDGTIRILMGSTMKLGTGTNIQERLVAIHNLEVPWKPSEMVQREGRIRRQGNRNKKVHICRYITEASFDAYTYQILENKQKFISQFLSGSLSAIHRDETDCSDIVLSYAEIKALAIGNPLIKRRVEVSNELEHARLKQRHLKKELSALAELSEVLPGKIEGTKAMISKTKKDIWHRDLMRENVSKEERIALGEELLYALAGNTEYEMDRPFSDYQGFMIVLPKHMKMDKPYIWLEGVANVRYKVEMDTEKVLGCCMRMDHALTGLDDVLARHEDKLKDLQVQQKRAKEDLEQGNIFDEQVRTLREELYAIDMELNEGGLAS